MPAPIWGPDSVYLSPCVRFFELKMAEYNRQGAGAILLFLDAKGLVMLNQHNHIFLIQRDVGVYFFRSG